MYPQQSLCVCVLYCVLFYTNEKYQIKILFLKGADFMEGSVCFRFHEAPNFQQQIYLQQLSDEESRVCTRVKISRMLKL